MNKEQALVAFEQHSIRGVAGKARRDLENMTGTTW
jgi:hypothetical protein